MKKLRSVLSFLMVLALCLSLVTAAFAAEEEEAAVEEVTEEVAEAPAEEVAYDGAENEFAAVEDEFPGGAYYRRDRSGKYTIEIGTWADVEDEIADGTVNCKSGNLAYIYPDADGELVTVTIYGEDLAKVYDLHRWFDADDPQELIDNEGWVFPQNSCTEGGVATRTCKLCGKVETQNIRPNGHVWSSEVDGEKWGEIITAPTCTEAGLAQDYCIVCGAMGDKTRVIEPSEHVWIMVVDKLPACVANSYTGAAGELGYEISALEFHTECAFCGAVGTAVGGDGKERTARYALPFDDLDAVEDVFDSGVWIQDDDGDYWYTFTDVAVKEIGGKEPKDATVSFAVKEIDWVEFGEQMEELYENGFHSGYELVYYTVKPTCTTPGKALYHCSVCGLREELDVDPLAHGMDLRYPMALNDFGALTFVRNKLVDCYTQTQLWKCSICGELVEGMWITGNDWDYEYDYDAHVWKDTQVKIHWFSFGETRPVESHVFDKDFEVEFGAPRTPDYKKFAVDLTSQGILDLFNAFAAEVIRVPGQQPVQPGQPKPVPELNKNNMDQFLAFLEQEAENGIEGFKEIKMPTCDEPGYLLVECVNTETDDRHEDDELEFAAEGDNAAEGKVKVAFDAKSGSYIIVEAVKDGRNWKWGSTPVSAKIYRVYTIAAIGHNWGSWNTYYTPNQDGNGNKNGYWERVCSICGSVDSRIAEVAPAPCTELGLQHRYVELSTDPSTCVVAGKTTYICEVCGDTYEVELPKAAHTPQAVAEVPATEEAPGVSAGVKCAVCGEVLEGCEVIEPVVENKFAVNTTGIEKTEAGVSGSGKIEKTEGNQPVGKQYVYVVVNYERADGSTWAVAGTYPVEADGSFDIPTISGVTDKLTNVLIVAVDAKVGADWAGHNVAPAAKV